MKKTNKTLMLGVAVGVVATSLMYLPLVASNIYEGGRAAECAEEARAWYNANTSQADATYFWLARGQVGELDYTVSQNFATKAHELRCIDTKLPTG